MLRVVIESPLGAPTRELIEENKAYAKLCVLDSLRRGEAPYASHLLFSQSGLLDDQLPAERRLGMEVGFAWGREAQLVAIYVDRGISRGMQEGIDRARHNSIPYEERRLY